MPASESLVRIISVSVPEVFVSSDDDMLIAEVRIANDTNLAHSAQVVFRGYVKKAGRLIYEFLHEQAWILIKPNETNTHKVSVEVWLSRFPPTMKLCDELEVEYCVRASVDPWCLNNYTEEMFRVHRTLLLKMPHICCYQKHIRVRRCVRQKGWYHRKCNPVNGDIWVDKGAYSSGEKIKLRWQLQLDSKPKKVKISLVQHITYSRAQNIDDDSDDDDDQDSDTNESATEQLQQDILGQPPITIRKLEIKGGNDMSLTNAEVNVTFAVTSTEPEKLSSLRLLLQGEVRAGSAWKTFIRYKAHISSSPNSLFSPGDHSVSVPLPFRDSQYDTNILPPSMDDDIRYVCYASTKPWQLNDTADETAVFVDRMVDTWAKQKFDSAYSEELGAYGIHMPQRAFQRGKYAHVSVTGDLRTVHLSLEQQRQLRIPGLKTDASYCHQRIVSSVESPEQRSLWPKQWALHIPKNMPPSIEITYWNVLILNYALKITLITEDGHEHLHKVPIWIGCTDDKLQPPENATPAVAPEAPEVDVIKDAGKNPPSNGPEEAPEFEVIQTGEVKEIPMWVDRYDDHTYS
ncbi:hypothetical protein OESDEN_12837 [Oesophagostomum dentatum]|uniref:Arrestin C-terminal-like domain-containing protein n=1 Tax=Oesophagostomum dentatum TaxID=61180 RepID=A0A0B1SU11_OESDE|nr:hypothetical protein OESDEN_12837 [Oesophagostomum dentatum]